MPPSSGLSLISDPGSDFLFVAVGIPPASGRRIMMEPDSGPLSGCCIISMGQYSHCYLSNLEYLLGVCECLLPFCLAGLCCLKSRMEGRRPSPRDSSQYLVPPCVRCGNCRVTLGARKRSVRRQTWQTKQLSTGRMRVEMEIGSRSIRSAPQNVNSCLE